MRLPRVSVVIEYLRRSTGICRTHSLAKRSIGEVNSGSLRQCMTVPEKVLRQSGADAPVALLRGLLLLPPPRPLDGARLVGLFGAPRSVSIPRRVGRARARPVHAGSSTAFHQACTESAPRQSSQPCRSGLTEMLAQLADIRPEQNCKPGQSTT